MIHETINEKPLSVNGAWKGRRFKSDEYSTYETLLLYKLPKRPMVMGIVEVVFHFYIVNDSRSDIDNFEKPLLDILVKKGYIEDDRKIYKKTTYKHHSDKPKIEVEIKPYVIPL